jgi:hypothetical protein
MAVPCRRSQCRDWGSTRRPGVKLVWPSSDCWLVIEEWEDERLFRAEIAVGRRFGQQPVEPSGGGEESLGAECADGGCETRVD